MQKQLQYFPFTLEIDEALTVADSLNLPHSSRCLLALGSKLNGAAAVDGADPE
jgi:hypothetical protein